MTTPDLGGRRRSAAARALTLLTTATVFYGLVTPLGRLRRLLGWGLGPRLRPDPSAKSYWVGRERRPPSRMDRLY